MLTTEEKRLRGLEANRRWREKNKEKERERHRRRIYSEEERIRRREYGKRYHQETRDIRQEYRKEYYEKNKDRLNTKSKEEVLFKNAQQRARVKQLPFDLVLSDIVIPEYCEVFPWIRLSLSNDQVQQNSPTVDRIVPERGYVKGNIRVISHKANSIKSYGTAEEHDLVADYIRRNHAD